jgi:hypothetical protein
MHQERDNKHADGDVVKDGAVPAYLLDRQNVSRAKVCILSLFRGRSSSTAPLFRVWRRLCMF